MGVDERVVCEAEEYGCVLDTERRENIEVVEFKLFYPLIFSHLSMRLVRKSGNTESAWKIDLSNSSGSSTRYSFVNVVQIQIPNLSGVPWSVSKVATLYQFSSLTVLCILFLYVVLSRYINLVEWEECGRHEDVTTHGPSCN